MEREGEPANVRKREPVAIRVVVFAPCLFRDQARRLARGLEPELSVAFDPMFPMPIVVDA